MGFATVLLTLSIISTLTATSTALGFNCSTSRTCHALIDYVLPNTTTISAVKTLFGVEDLRTILGANNYPPSTPSNFTIPATQKIKIPFPCNCSNGTGISNKIPVYTVQKDDFLYHIAAEVFSRLIAVNDIQTFNKIPNADLIEIGQNLTIPLPCSCDAVDGMEVVHYGYVVASGNTVEQIALQYNTTQDTLLRLNGLASANDLKADSVLDVPLKACSSKITSQSLDYPLLVSNGTYVFTANGCVMCNCDSANNGTLQCQPSPIQVANVTCPSMQCEAGGSSFYIGNTTTSSTCNRTTCAYAGYTQNAILTTIVPESTCPASDNNAPTPSDNAPTPSDNNAPRIGLRGLSWNFFFICVQLVILCLHLFQ